MATAPAAHFRPRDTARCLRAARDGVFRLRDGSGREVDRLAVLAGEWVVISGGTAVTESGDDTFRRLYDAVPGREGIFARKSPPVSLRQPLGEAEAREFAAGRLRCAADGSLLCDPSDPLHVQLSAVRSAPGGGLHAAALHALRAAAGSRPVYDPAIQADLHMFDLECTDLAGETPDTREDTLDSGIQPDDIPGLVEEAASLDGVTAPRWTPMDAMPGRGPQLDALRARLFGDLTDLPLGRIMATLHPHAEAGNPLDGFMAWLRDTAEARPLERQPDFSNIVPGYVAKVGRHARDGVEFLVVEDFAGAYVYSWPDRALPSPGPGL